MLAATPNLLLPLPRPFPKLSPHLPSKPKAHFIAHSSSTDSVPSSPSKPPNPLAAIWTRTWRPLIDFGFGRRSVREGGVGLFVTSGAVILALTLVWLKGSRFRSRFRKYQAVFEFSQACGICAGTPVRIRGVTVGSVIGVNASLKSIDAVVEVEDDKIVIPRDSAVEVNQSGLLMETMIDITPRDPLRMPSRGPLDVGCAEEGLIVCDKERVKGDKGVSLDELVGIFTRIGREVDKIGVAQIYALAERVAAVIHEAQPLVAKIETMVEDIQPLLAEVRESALLKDIESLTKSLTQATEDMRKLQSSILTPENSELIRQSISTLMFTLKNIESISSDISGFTGDEAARQNLKLLIRSLSRLL